MIWKTREPATAGCGLKLVPDMIYAGCPQFDLIYVPGGGGMNPLLEDEETRSFLRRQAKGARYVTSVCTGCWCWAPRRG